MKVFELKIKAYLEAEGIKEVMDGLLLGAKNMNIVEVKIFEVADTSQITDAIETALTTREWQAKKKTKPEDLN